MRRLFAIALSWLFLTAAVAVDAGATTFKRGVATGGGTAATASTLVDDIGCVANDFYRRNGTDTGWVCSASSAAGYSVILEDGGAPLTSRTTLNFIGTNITCVDNPGATRTDCTVTAGTGDVTDVGNCATGACFGGASGTILTSTTGETVNMATDGTILLQRNTAGVMTLLLSDDAGPTDAVIRPTGAGSNLTIGGGGTTQNITIDASTGGNLRLLGYNGVTVESSDTFPGVLQFTDGDSPDADETISISAPTSTGLTASYTLTLPPTAGTASQVLTTAGPTGVLSWTTPAPGGGTVNNVGNCNGPDCFTGTEGTILTSTTGETINMSTQNTFNFTRDSSGSVTITSSDTVSPSDLIIDPSGAGTLQIGNSDETALTTLGYVLEVKDNETGGYIRLFENPANGTNYVGFTTGGPSFTTSYDLALPVNAGSAGDQLTTNGFGTLSWAAASSGILQVGDCSTSPCFNGANGTLLKVNAGLQIDLDDDNEGTTDTFNIRNGANTAILIVDEASGSTAIPAGHLTVRQAIPEILMDDSNFPVGGTHTGNFLIGSNCVTDNDCGWHITQESGTAGTRMSSITAKTTDAGVTSLYLGISAEDSVNPPTDAVVVTEPAIMNRIGTGEIRGTEPRCITRRASEITCHPSNGVTPDGCTGATVDGTGVSFETANFPASASGNIDSVGTFQFRVPQGWTGVELTINLEWTSTAGTCNNEAADDICWQADSGSVADDEALTAPTLGGTAKGVNDTCILTGDLMKATITDYVHGMEDGELGLFVLTRDVDGTPTGCASADDFPDDAQLVAVRLCAE